PMRSSSARTVSLTDDLAVCSAAAAAVKLPRSTTAAKASIPAKLSIRRLFATANDLSRTSRSAASDVCRIPVLSQLKEMDMTETRDVLGAPMPVQRDADLFPAEQPIPPGYFVPPHRHADDEEMLYVIEGELTLIDETGESRAAAGSCLHFE